MAFWKTSVISDLELSVFDSVFKAQYKIADTWYDCNVINKGIENDHRFFIFEVPSTADGTITGVRLIDSNLAVLAEKTVNITKTTSRVFSFKITFKVSEQE